LNDRARVAALGVVAAAPAFIGYADVILNHFYRHGAVLLDTGLLADLAWHQGAGLAGSALLDGKSFYAFHIAPIFVVLSALSWLVPVAMTQWFALVTGAAHAALAAAVFWMLTAAYRLRGGWRVAMAMAFAVAFSFNGLAIAQIRYPHFEILLAAGMILFLVAWWRQRYAAASVLFILCLLCREDAGFHLFAVLAVLVALRWRDGMTLSAQRPALIFLALGFAYSLAALLLGIALFPDHSSFARVYLGTPPFAHLSAGLVAIRALGFAIARAYIFLPALIAVIWAIAARNPYLLVGYIAFIPWTLLHLLANSDLAGTLSSYYGFPYLVAAFWPLIGWRMGMRQAAAPLWQPLLGFGAMILASFAALSAQHDPSHLPLVAGFADPPSFAEQARVERAIAAIHRDHAALGRVLAGDSVAALRPGEFAREETFWDGPPGRRDTLLSFAGDRDAKAIADLAAASGLARNYAVAGTPIRIVTDRRPADLPALAPLLEPAAR
jgi:hypothetical protein